MSATYKPVSWNRFKLIYDAAIVAAVAAFHFVFTTVGAALPAARAIDEQTLSLRAWGLCAFLLLTLALAIGPLARLDTRFLPLLYNRRHLGVITAIIAATHASAVLGWYYAYAETPPAIALWTADTSYGQLRGFPFTAFGAAALVILAALAATSHDFWLAFLTPPVWKTLHFGIYVAYLAAVAHIAFGAMQVGSPTLELIVGGSCALLIALHLLAAAKRRAPPIQPPGFIAVPAPDRIVDGQAMTLRLPNGRAVAVVRDAGRLYAVSNACAHQNGPLGEGCVVDGSITCPWHGFQYRLSDGCAPAPFTERIETYKLIHRVGRIWLDPTPNPLGTSQPPLRIAEADHE